MMKRLIVCCDGTWNSPDQEDHGEPTPTNVVKTRNCIAERDADGVEQVVYYHAGVGTEGGIFKRTAGGAFGEGLDQNIKSAYHWLASQYAPGDEVYLFGFSRGAYTVRSLGGMITACGLLDLHGLDAPESWRRTDAAYDRCYRVPREERRSWADPAWPFHDDAKPIPIRFLGVWDTVGALGIPDDLSLLNVFDDPARWRFHDTDLGPNVLRARHALALDEMRASFTPTLWTRYEGRDVEQVWFPGVHSDVGGGYPSSGLSDIALKWMLDQAAEPLTDSPGLVLRPGVMNQLKADPQATLHDSVRGLFKALRTRPRSIPPIAPGAEESLHPSVLARQENPPIFQGPYHPTRVLEPGASATVHVFARERWNTTGLYLPPGNYELTATGEWLDSRIKCGPGGTKDGKFYPQEVLQVVGTFWGKLEGLWKKATNNQNADFWGSRRAEDMPWMALVGVIANDVAGANPGNDGSPQPHQRFLIGDHATMRLEHGGYLYAFANDAWATYENNRGSVALSVSRSG